MKKRKKKGWEEKREDVQGDIREEERRKKKTNVERRGSNHSGAARKERRRRRDKEKENLAEDRRYNFIHLIPLEQTLLLPGLHLVLRASPPPLHLQIVSFVNTLSSRCVTPVWQKESFVINPTSSPIAPSASFAIQNAFFPGRFVYTRASRDSSRVESSRGNRQRPNSTSCFSAASVDTDVRRANKERLAGFNTFTHSPSDKHEGWFLFVNV